MYSSFCHLYFGHLAIAIGFEETQYTFIEPPFTKSFHVSLVKEDNRISEQTFQVLVQVSNSTNPFQAASEGEDYQTMATLHLIFPPNQQFISKEFRLLPNEDIEENEAFRLILSSVGHPSFLTNSTSLYNETLVVINDAQSKSVLKNICMQ